MGVVICYVLSEVSKCNAGCRLTASGLKNKGKPMCSSDAKGGRTKRQNQKDPDFEASDFSKRDGQCAGMAV